MMKELSDTVDEMLSDNYKDRFIAEVDQLSIRLGKLKNMIEKWDNGTLGFVPTCPRKTYDSQIKAMEDYLAILKRRAHMEGIEIG